MSVSSKSTSCTSAAGRCDVVAIFRHCTKRGAWTVESTGAAGERAYRADELKKKFYSRDFLSQTVARHHSEHVTFTKKGEPMRCSRSLGPRLAAYTPGTRGLPKRVRSPRALAIRTQGVADTTRIKTAVFFVPVSIFFRKFAKSRWFFCALCAMQLRACILHSLNLFCLSNNSEHTHTQSFHFFCKSTTVILRAAKLEKKIINQKN